MIPIAVMKTSSRNSPPSAAHQADFVTIKQMARISSSKGKRKLIGRARGAGKPKSVIAFLEPSKSASFVIPAKPKTLAKSNVTTRMATSTIALHVRRKVTFP